MIVIEEPARLALITQSDHARLARNILALWREDGLALAPWRQTLLLATAEHDNGWWESDAAPSTTHSSGWPRDFRDVPSVERMSLWRSSVDRLARQQPDVAFLILLHAQRIHHDFLTRPGWRSFVEFLEKKKLELEAELSFEVADLVSAYEFLWLADSLSLDACGTWGGRQRSWRDYTIDSSPGRLRLRPFPFAGRSTLQVRCRFIAKRRYAGVADLGGEMAAARWQSVPVSIEPVQAP